MMRIDRPRFRTGVRAALLAAIIVLGLVAIVGSGGGSLGFPPCGPPICSDGPYVPPPEASMTAPRVTALVGTTATFSVTTQNTTGPLSYQWSRSNDGGTTYVEIPGATLSTYTTPTLNLSDDGAQFKVVVLPNVLVRVGRLTVSAVPGLVFQDGEFVPSDWLASAVANPAPTVPVHSEEQLASGGNPGAYRRMVFTIPQGTGSARVFYTSVSAAYQPQSQGAINVIDYAEDCILLSTSATVYAESQFFIEQAGRRYLTSTTPTCALTRWAAVTVLGSLTAQDFYRFDGPVCGAGESCPDFSANGAPMQFGYLRAVLGLPGDSIAHGIDNWKVTVWRR